MLALVLPFILVFASLPLTSSGQNPEGPWIITQEETFEDIRLLLDRQLVVASGATLWLKETTIHVSHGGGILVAPGGTLRIEDSELKQHAQSDYWSFQVFGRLMMNNSALKGSYGIDLHYAGTIGSQIENSLFHKNHDHAVFVLRRGEVTFNNNLVVENNQGIRVKDATAHVEDNVFLGNPSFAIVLTSSLIGSRTFGPTMAQVSGNVIAHGGGGLGIQEGDSAWIKVQQNLLTNLTIGMRLQEGDESGGQAEFTKNSLVDNHAAAANLPRGGEREAISDLVGYSVDLGDSWLGPEGAVTELDARNYLYGPFNTSELLDHDPVIHLWQKLQDIEADA